MREAYLTQLEIWVCEDDLIRKAIGFIALENNYIAALFVSPGHQGKGIGFRLIEKAKKLHRELGLSVYKENPAAITFYERQGFIITAEGIEPETGHPELKMKYKA